MSSTITRMGMGVGMGGDMGLGMRAGVKWRRGWNFGARRGMGLGRYLAAGLLAGAVMWGGMGEARGQQVEKVIDNCEAVGWTASPWNKAKGEVMVVEDVAEAVRGESKHAMRVEARFSGKGFEYFTADSSPVLTIPGDGKRVTMYVKAEGDYPWVVSFRDGWGRDKVGSKKLEWDLSKKVTGQWQEVSFEIPGDWVKPVSIAGITTHNWSSKDKEGRARLYVDQVRVVTDVSGVDGKTGKLRGWKAGPADEKGKVFDEPVTPMLSVGLTTEAMHNVFVDVEPAIRAQARSWKPGEMKGELTWMLTDGEGKQLAEGKQALSVSDVATVRIAMPVKRYGVYAAEAEVKWADGLTVRERLPMAMIPKGAELTEREKMDSPYGLNVHGGRARMVQTFRDAGVVWFRDYAFNYDWMVRAKGEDGKYAGWPYYPPLVKEYDDAGAMLLACHASAIRLPGAEAGTKEADRRPSLQWTRELVQMVLAFDSIRYHELDNEYDLPSHGASKLEEKIGWANYGNYHKVFGEVLHLLGGGQLVTVENGRAGIWPERVEAMVKGGYFDEIDVVNSHHYTGVEPPEVNVLNANTDATAADRPRLFFDQLRDATRAGRIDGKQRQHWLTEFGWDTKAGHVVSDRQQAAYLQRAYMMLMAADVAKGFWFFDMDSATPNNFFDGCGLVDDKQMPKLSLAAFAGMTKLMPVPKFVGIINAGPGTWGYMIRNGEDLVASLWTIDDVKGPGVQLEGKLYDYLANPIEGESVTLGLMPVYAVGVSTDSMWYRQTAYMLASAYLEAGASGDTVKVRLQVKNNRKATITASATMTLPAGWKAAQQETAITVQPGETAEVPLNFTISSDEPLGEKLVTISIQENGQMVKQIPLRVRVQPAITMVVDSLIGKPGETQVKVTLRNSSASMAIGGVMKLALPTSWSAPQREIAVEKIEPRTSRTITVPLTWSDSWKPGESASVQFTSDKGHEVRWPLIPSRLALHRAGAITIDGKLDDWKAEYQIPSWMLGSTGGSPQAQVFAAWAGDGLYIAAQVHDSQVRVTSPTSFWNGDVMELFINTKNQKVKHKYAAGDHQFWFVVQPEQGRVFAGQWKRGDELPATRNDIGEIKSAGAKTSDGYIMEMFIPASQLAGYRGQVGTEMAMNVNLSVIGLKMNREVYWPTAKRDAAPEDQSAWGTVTLQE